MKRSTIAAFLILFPWILQAAETVPDYAEAVVPIFRKYCISCHNQEDREGGLSLESYADLLKGGQSGPAVLPGAPASSRFLRLVEGVNQPIMPPEGSDGPTASEVNLLKAWVTGGATGPQGAEPDRRQLMTPKIKSRSPGRPAVTALAWSPAGNVIAVGQFRKVELVRAIDRRRIRTIEDLPGKVTDLKFSADGLTLAVASGISGLTGHASLWNVETGRLKRKFEGHRDILYAVALDVDGKHLATAGYDREIVIWDTESGTAVRTLKGHNAAVYSLAFHPRLPVLASASGDETVKLWNVNTGTRLDTLGQPQAEQYSVVFTPNGQHIIAAGADHRIRIWKFVSTDRPRINPLQDTRFAHEAAITQLTITSDGSTLVSLSEDRLLKTWTVPGLVQSETLDLERDHSFAASAAPSGKYLVLARGNGVVERRLLKTAQGASELNASAGLTETRVETASLPEVAESEPNQGQGGGQQVDVPVLISGKISGGGRQPDEDVFRFKSRKGQQWMIEVRAARDKSPLDSIVEVLDADGQVIPRVQLRAVRDSYFTFRGKDSNTIDDFRVHNWEEMELNEYLYCNGEVVRLWLYPRGPDSGFQVYPGRGKRYTYFDTSPLSHALHEPCYVVEPYPVGVEIPANGLPVFQLNYENDDDPRREWGSDSRLTFEAPDSGEYQVRLRDVRGFQGSDFKYQLSVRERFPDFEVTLSGANPTINPGSGREFNVSVKRKDGFEGAIRVDIDGLPPGFHASTPIVIEARQTIAFGVIWADPDAAAPEQEWKDRSQVSAIATIADQQVRHVVNGFGEIKLGDQPKLIARLMPHDSEEDGHEDFELVIHPGQTISARVIVERQGFNGRVAFGTADAGRNLPHGVFVDNIGLNGLLILENTNERTFFISAADWVPETTRLFHLLARVEGNQATIPILLRVRKPEQVADR